MGKADLSDLVAKKIFSATRVLKSPHMVITQKCRPRWAIAYKAEGKTEYRFGTKKYICDSLHPVLLPKGAHYQWECIEEGECMMLDFECDAKRESPVLLSLSDTSQFIKSFCKIERNRARGELCFEPENLKEFYTILCLFESKETEYLPKKKIARLRPALDYISAGYRENNITTCFLASLCGMPDVTFRKLFRAALGVSPIKYLKNLRMERAKELLSGDYASVSQVAESVGYKSIYQFSKAFKQSVGVSPSEYSKR